MAKHESQIIRDEHNETLNAKQVSIVSATTIYAITDLNAVEQISLASIHDGVNLGVSGNVTVFAGASFPITITSGTTVSVASLPNVTWTSGATVGVSSLPVVSWNSGATVAVSNLPALSAGLNNIGFATISGTVKDAGSTKTEKQLPFIATAAGSVTVFVPSNTFYATHMMIGSDATVSVILKSGPTPLIGNASIGLKLLPGGGWVQDGSVDSPVYQGVVGAAGFVVETDATANVVGYIKWFDE